MRKPRVLVKGRFGAQDIDVTISKISIRKIIPELEFKSQEIWQQRLIEAKKKDQLLYDGISFRLNTFNVNEVGTLSLDVFVKKLSDVRISEEMNLTTYLDSLGGYKPVIKEFINI